jgi:hypothetical protein
MPDNVQHNTHVMNQEGMYRSNVETETICESYRASANIYFRPEREVTEPHLQMMTQRNASLHYTSAHLCEGHLHSLNKRRPLTIYSSNTVFREVGFFCKQISCLKIRIL